MKKFIVLFFLAFSGFIYSNGVGVINAQNGIYLKLLSSNVSVLVEDQVSIVTTTQSFKNIYTSGKTISYVFPTPESASITGLEWYINGVWHTASFVAGAPDTTILGPGIINQNLLQYIGRTPLFFAVPDTIMADSILTVRLTYVQLLKYEFGKVIFSYPNDYHLIQSTSVDLQKLSFSLSSQRTIDSIKILNFPGSSITNNGYNAAVQAEVFEQPAVSNYNIEYSLNLNELGLFSMSSSVPANLLPDSVANGFFIFVAEPNPNQTDIINKVFTLIIDRSGSMSGTKMTQARDAAKFIVNHLNEGDKFNIIDFDDIITSFQPGHVPFNSDYKALALNYINGLYARGMTNISGAFGTAIPQFVNVNDSTANIIVFFTDGEATAGITTTQGILDYVNQQTSLTDTSITIFTFGIGSYVNEQLLTLLASQHHGLCEFLKADELEERISKFYLKIRNPVLINTQLSISPQVIIETYPDPLPNLYKGQQLIVAGRYQESALITVTLSGNAFGQPVSYQYQIQLADSSVQKYLFLTKIWAKLKIENLLVLYYSYGANSPEANAVKAQIIRLSIDYGVSSPFTNLAIPVALTSFTAKQNSSHVELLWTTATETNNRGFEIQRRTRNSEFITISFISGNGTTVEPNYYRFVDDNITEDYYVYRLKQLDYNGNYKYSDEVEIQVNLVPEEYNISQNYPNPFNPVTTIAYSLPVVSSVRLEIYNVLGELISIMVNGIQVPGNYIITWDASSEPSGVYFYKIIAKSADGRNTFTSARKMIVIK
jgi:Ca-activated chloride channel homolog